MTAVHIAIVSGGALMLTAATTAAMVRLNRSEKQTMERRWREWADSGSDPDSRPNFYSGSPGGGGGAY